MTYLRVAQHARAEKPDFTPNAASHRPRHAMTEVFDAGNVRSEKFEIWCWGTSDVY